jgi:hypothetical protein
MKEPWGKAVGRFDHMIDDLGLLWVKLGLLCLQIGEPSPQASADLRACEVLMIGQDLVDVVHPSVGLLDHWEHPRCCF